MISVGYMDIVNLSYIGVGAGELQDRGIHQASIAEAGNVWVPRRLSSLRTDPVGLAQQTIAATTNALTIHNHMRPE
jgi:hypothetical protein